MVAGGFLWRDVGVKAGAVYSIEPELGRGGCGGGPALIYSYKFPNYLIYSYQLKKSSKKDEIKLPQWCQHGWRHLAGSFKPGYYTKHTIPGGYLENIRKVLYLGALPTCYWTWS